MTWICWQCRKPTATLALRGKTGYADGPRPSCVECYGADDRAGIYARNRFSAHELPGPPYPRWLLEWRVEE
jgi:hypothetical protein